MGRFKGRKILGVILFCFVLSAAYGIPVSAKKNNLYPLLPLSNSSGLPGYTANGLDYHLFSVLLHAETSFVSKSSGLLISLKNIFHSHVIQAIVSQGTFYINTSLCLVLSLLTSRHLAIIGKVIHWAKECFSARLLLLLLLFLAFETVCQAQTQPFTSNGTFTVPAGVTSITVEAWGAGGAGGGNTTSADGGGGGGGGGYSKSTFTSLIPGNSYTVNVGTGGIGGSGKGGDGGDTWFNNNTTLLANGGKGGSAPSGGNGGIAGAGGLSGIGTTVFSGGNGGTGIDNNTGQGGPGGSSAGTGANGTSGSNVWSTITAAAAPAGGGKGGNGGAAGFDGSPGAAPGGGGGGSGDLNKIGGNGANGKVIVSWTCPANAGTLSGASNICISGGTTTFTSTVTGGTWSSSNPAVATIIPSTGVITAQASGGGGTVTMTYTIPASGGCPQVTATKNLTVDNLPTVGVGSALSDICQGGTSAALGGTIGGGATGGIWSTPDGGTFSPSATNLNATWTPPAGYSGTTTLTLTTTGGTCTATSNFKTLTVNPVISNNIVSSAQSICTGTAPTPLTGTTPTGGTGTYTYLWESSTTGSGSGFATASGTSNAQNYTPGTLTQTTWYRRTVTSGGCSSTSTAIQITVNPVISNNTVSSAQSICTGTAPSALTGTLPTGGTGTYTYLWESSTTGSGSGFATASGTSNTQNYTPGTLTQTTWYRRTVTSGGCSNTSAAIQITVNPNNTITLSSAAGTDSQTKCINTAITNITYTTTGATGATFAGLPAGVSGNWAANTVTISGTPTASGTFNYTITLTGGCGSITKTGSINVTPDNTITLSSAAGTDSQSKCINTAITNITYSTTGATGATFAGLPAGVTGNWAANTVTISGTPTASGTFNYTITLSGGCGTVTKTGVITVTADNTIALSSAAGTDTQTKCINTAITNITYTTTGATGATFSGLPAGVTGSWAANTVTISGIPTASGTFNYTITLTGGCGSITKTGSIIVTPDNTIALSSAAGTDSQTKCINTAITNITYTTTGATGATFAGLPAGVSGNWAANTVTISGTPTASGTFNYTITLTGGCGSITKTGSINVTPDNTITLSSAAGTDSQTKCINTAITNITYTTTGATGATFSGLPAGVTGSWAGNTVTISGTPTVNGTFSYTITLTGGCGTVTKTGSIRVNPDNTIALSSVAGTDSQTKCINTAITYITYTTTGATGATFAGLPAGVTGSWAGNTVTISGTPTVNGTFNYTITLTGGCGTLTKTGSITVTPDNTIALSSAAGTDSQTRCINTAITSITYTTTGATGATFAGLPAGVTGSWAANAVSISGTPTVAGAFSYTITLTGGCGTVTKTGVITVTADNTITLSSAAGTDSQIRCINTAITNITYTTTGATGATFAGLPTGVTGSWAANTVTISGTPTISGTSNYTITLTGGCGIVTQTGSIRVNPDNTITLSSAAGTDSQTRCINTAITNITYTTTGATGIGAATGLPSGVTAAWAANILTISGTPTVSGTFNYSIPLTGGCGNVSATGTITVTANNTVSAASSQPTLCINTAMTAITHTTTGATGIGAASGLPSGVTAAWAANILTISGTPTVSGIFNYSIPLTGGCGNVNATGIITVNANNTVSAASLSPTVCVNTPIPGVTHATTGATGIGAASGLPTGVTAAWAANILTISGTPTASGTFNYSIPLTGGCGPVISATGTIFVNPSTGPTVFSSGSTVVCQDSPDEIYTASAANNTSVSYSVSPAGAGTINAATGVMDWNAAFSGTATITATSTGLCTTTTADMPVTVKPLVGNAGAIGGNLFVFPSNAGLVYSIPVVANATSYLWTVPAGWTITSGQNTNSITVTSGTAGQDGNITVTAGNSCGTSPASILSVEVDQALTVVTQPANQANCQGSSVGFNVVTSGGAGTITYVWQRKKPTDATFSTIAGDPDITYPTAASILIANIGSASNPTQTQYRVVISDSNGSSVTSDAATLTSNAVTGISPTDQTICENGNVSFTVSTDGTFPVSYQWVKYQGPGVWNDVTNGGAISGATTATLTFTGADLSDAGKYDVRVEFPVTQPNTIPGNPSTCFSTSTIQRTLSINPLPVLTAGASVCVGKNIVLGPSVGGSWTSSDVTVATVTNAGVVTGIAPGSVTFTYTQTATGCSSTTSVVNVYSIPDVIASPSTQSICSGDATSVALSSSIAGTTFSWTVVQYGVTGAANGAGNSISQSLTASGSAVGTATYTITPSANGCNGNPVTVVITVNPIPTVTTPSNQTFCNATVTSAIHFTGAVTGTIYNWTNNTTGIGLAANGTGDIGAFNAVNTGNSPVTATITVTPVFDNAGKSCNGSPQTFTITVNPTPNVIATPGSQSICSGDATSIALSSSIAGTSFSWTVVQSGVTGAANGSGNSISQSLTASGSAVGTATYTITPSANGCNGNPVTVVITVNNAPTLTGVSQAVPVCAGSTSTMNLTGMLPNTTSTITYSINGVAQTPVANILSDAAGNASFTTAALTGANNGQILKITGITITSYSPNCSKSFSMDATLAVNSLPAFTTCPSSLNLNSSATTCTATGTYSVVASGSPVPTYSYTFTGATTDSGTGTGSGATFNPGTTHVRVTATNSCSSVDCTFDVTVVDNVAPVISGCPSNITVNTGTGVNGCGQVASWTEPTAVDNCTAAGSLVWTKSHSPGSIFPVGTTTVTYTVKDANNTPASCSFTVTVVDDTPPTFTPPAATTIYTDASCNVSRIPAITGNVTVKSDNCTPASGISAFFTDGPNVAGACPGTYSFTRTWTVSDLNGNSTTGTQVITVADNIKPTLTVPPAKAISCTDSPLPANTGTATATDNCLAPVAITYSDVTTAGTCAGNSTIKRTWKATDCSGLFTTADQIITITDNQVPVVTIKDLTVASPDLIPLKYTTLAAFLADGGNTATDNCSAPVDIQLWSEVANGLENKPGYCPTSITRTYRFTDQCGISVDKIQTITVQNDGGCSKCTSGTTFEWVDLLGNPSGTMSFTDKRNGKCCNATGSDKCISFNVRIDPDAVGVEILIDGAAPSSQDWRIDCNPISMTNSTVCLPGGDFHLFTYCKPGNNANTYTFRSIPGVVTSEGISTRVECSGQITTTGILNGATWNSISPGAPGQYNSYLSSTTVPNPIFTAGPGAPSVIKYEVCGNIGSTVCNTLGRDCAEVTINVKPKIALSLNVNPTMTCVNNPLVLVADINPSSNYTYEWHTGQGATSTPILSTSKTLTLLPPVALGWYSLKVTDMDASGYACSTDTFDFQVQADLTGPSVLVPPSGDLTVNCNNPNANALIQSWLASATSKDDAGNPLTVSNNYTGISMVCGTVLPVIFSATDNCGNINADTANIRVIDNVAPTWQTAAGTLNRTIECSDATALLTAQALAPVAVDACDLSLTLAKTSGSFVAGSCPLSGTITNTWTATDDCGNVSGVFTQVITITDTQGPVWMTAAGNLDRTVACSDAAGLAAAQALTPAASDLCDGSTVLTKTSGVFVSSGCGGAGTYTNTWKAKDACNNTSTVYTQVITISQATLPVMTAPASISVACGTLPSSSTLPFTNVAAGGCLITGTSNPSTFSAMPSGACGGTVTETWTATDACGRALAPVTRTITINPAALPTMTAPAAITIACGAPLPAPSTISFTNGGAGGCLITGTSNPSTFSVMPSGACGGTVTETWTATDACGRALAPVTRTITISPATLPTMTPPADITVACDALPSPSTLLYSNGETGGCLISGTSNMSTLSVQSPAGACGGTIIETWTATDACGRALAPVTRTITVSPAALPTMTALANTTIACGAALPAATRRPYTNGGSGACLMSGNSNLSTFSAMPPDACGGTVTETWTATDACGRALAPVTRTITISPATLPTMTPPAAITLACGDPLPDPSTLTYTNSKTGGCLITGQSNLSTFSAMPGACGGIVTETWTATDNCGRALAPVTRRITISPAALPTMTAPADITVDCGGLPAPSAIPYTNGGAGGCLISGTSSMSTFSVQSPAGACGGTVIETWRATDACGRALAPVTRTITVNPAPLPTMTAPADITVTCTAIPAPSTRTFTNGVTGACRIIGTSNLSTLSPNPGSCGGTMTETWTATDNCGRALAPVTRTITVSPAALPTMTPPAAITLACGDPLPDPSTLTYTNSGAGGCLITGQSNLSTFSAMPGVCGGTVTETWTATDNCGRALVTKTRTITISPAPLPTMTAPADITVDCGGLPAPSAIPYSNGGAGGCLISGTSSMSTFSVQSPAGACGGTVIETWRATDACGRTLAPVTRTITVNPAALPTMTPPADITVSCTAVPAPSTRAFTNGLTGACKISGTSNLSTLSAHPGSCGGTMTETWTATDNCGRALAPITRTITVSPAALPTMTPPAAITLACGDPLPASSTLTYTNSGAGGCIESGTSNPSTFSAIPGTCGGTVTETWTATDNCGRALAPVTRTITISPAALPIMTAPADITVNCGALPAPSAIPYTNGGAGGCLISGTSSMSTFSVQSPAGACGGTVIETWRATDACGRALAPVTRTITVNPAPLPTMTAPADITISCGTAPSSSTRPFTNGGAGGCLISGTSNPSTFSAMPATCSGTVTETWTATDACGRALAPITRTINIVDNTAPVMNTQAQNGSSDCVSVDPDTDAGYVAWLANHGGATASDVCDSNLDWTDNSSTQNWVVDLVNHTKKITITFTATDDCGNFTATVPKTYTLYDNLPPVITFCPADVAEVIAPDGCSKTNVTIGTPIYSDLCSTPALTYKLTGATVVNNGIGIIPPSQVFNLGKTTVTYTVTDDTGLSVTCSFEVWIKRLDIPTGVITCPANPAPADAQSGSCTAFITVNAPTIVDPCPTAGYTIVNSFNNTSNASGNYPVGTTTVVWTITDNSNNTNTSCSQTVIVNDTQAPSITCQNNVEEMISADDCSKTGVNIAPPVVTDNCPNPLLSWTLTGVTTGSGTGPIPASQVFNVGKTRVHYTVSDSGGLRDTCSFQVWIKHLDIPLPKIDCPASPAPVDAEPDKCTAFVTVNAPTIIDPCPTAGYTIVNSFNNTNNASGNYPVGTTIVFWTITDNSDNTNTSCSQTVIVKDTQAPVITTCPVARNIIDCSTSVITGPVLSTTPAVSSYAEFSDATNKGVATDQCGIATVTYMDVISGTCPITVTRTWTLMDGAGNKTPCDQIITITDNEAPVVSCPVAGFITPSDFDLSFGTYSIPAFAYSDNCTPAGSLDISWTLSGATTASGTGLIPTPYQFNTGVTTVSYVFKDLCGNSTPCQFTVTALSPPNITCLAAPKIYTTDPGNCTHRLPTDVNNPGAPTNNKTESLTWIWTIINPDGTTGATGTSVGATAQPIDSYDFQLGTSTINWRVENASGHADCSHQVTVEDKQAPTFTAMPVEFCVEPLSGANYSGNADDLNYLVNYPVADYHLFRTASPELDVDMSTYTDNCCSLADGYTMRWIIDYQGTNPSEPSISGTGQPSAYGVDIKLWGDGITFTNRVHTITYWITDCHGNESAPNTVTITIKPRPELIKTILNNP